MPLKIKLLNIIVYGALLLVYPFCAAGQDVSDVSRIKTVVIDPGHGGKDPGAISRNGKYKEKNITLSVALKLGDLIKDKYPEIKVVYTRSTDKYVGLSERAEIANRNKADLFISIHVNSAKATQARGTETFVMGAHKSDDNFEVCKTENSVIVIEDDYQKKYEGFNPNSPESYIIFSLLQNMHQEQSIKYAAQVQANFAKGPIPVNRGVKQGGLLVLWKTTMPAILTELGFISNSNDCAVLITKNGQEQFAKGLFNAFEAYKKDFEKESGAKTATETRPVQQKKPQVENKPVREADKDKGNKLQGGGKTVQHDEKLEKGSPATGDEFYAVQILSVGKKLAVGAYDLKGRKDAKYLQVGKLYKYYVGRYATRGEAIKALPEVRKTFPGAFVIHVKDNNIVK